MILGIDFGASTTDAVLLDGKRIVKKASTKQLGSARSLNSFLKKHGFHFLEIERTAITGGKSALFSGKVLGLKPVHVNEIDAIGLGAGFLSKSKRCLAVSMGTGTCIVLFERPKSRHVIGTGLGGGTITGLSRLLLKEQTFSKLADLASRGDFRRVDLSVAEVVGKSLGLLNGSATASNFAKASGSRADLAAAVQNMVAESVAVLAVSSSKQSKCKKIVFLGKAWAFPLVKNRLNATARCFGAKFLFPKNGGFGSALGAVLSLQGKLR